MPSCRPQEWANRAARSAPMRARSRAFAGIADSIGFILNWLRLLFVLLGLVILCLGIYKLFRKRWLSGTLLSVLGAILILLAILGFSFSSALRRRAAEAVSEAVAARAAVEAVSEADGGSGDGCFGGEQHQVEEWIVRQGSDLHRDRAPTRRVHRLRRVDREGDPACRASISENGKS